MENKKIRGLIQETQYSNNRCSTEKEENKGEKFKERIDGNEKHRLYQIERALLVSITID